MADRMMTNECLFEYYGEVYSLDCWKSPSGRLGQLFRSTVYLLSYQFILNRKSTRTVSAVGFNFIVRPTDFHPKLFFTGEFFSKLIGTLDLCGKRVVEVRMGSGILALTGGKV